MDLPRDQAMSEQLPEILTPAELAELLRMHLWTVYEHLRTGAIPGARKIGQSWRISRDVVLEWIKEGER